jgi:hypothetical protein
MMSKPMCLRTVAVVVLAMMPLGGGHAAVISVDFNNTTSAAWTLSSGEAAGPLDSTNWNSTSTASGGPVTLVDDTGASTTATLTWSSSNTWTEGDGNGTANTKLAHAYLDDGGSAVQVTVSNLPYADYRVYGLFASDNATGIRNWDVNGNWVLGVDANTTAAAYATLAANQTANGEAWTEILPGSITGNYWTFVSSGSTLTINGLNRSGGNRGSLTGLVIEAVPEPTTLVLLGIATAGAIVARFRRRP